ncbi:MAG: zf-HC2 domain-containing protein [Planctomycetaceae bacterium]|nr:zf-HC2 domain-containing protein [Planctomycetaceae bacterium]
MRCEEFLEHLHERLDQRLPLESDRNLKQHAANCEECWSELRVWLEIAPLLKSDHTECAEVDIASSSKRYRALPPILTAALAVAILIAVVGISPTKSNSKPILSDVTASSDTLAQATGELDPVLWWRSVQDRDWVEETMPTVRSVRQGVAPLGRTLVRAVTILTIGGEGRTS